MTFVGTIKSVVCPTYVGMNRGAKIWNLYILRMPHVCGDEPITLADGASIGTYAPRMWG